MGRKTGAGKRRIFQGEFIGITAFIFFLVLSGAGGAAGASFTVTSGYDVNDRDPGNGLCVAYIFISPPFVIPFCTLRAAIEEANALPGPDIILLGSGTYRLTLSGRGENNAATGDLDLTDSLQIIGSGADRTFIDADGLDRVFDVFGAGTRVTFSRLSILHGRLPAGLVSEQKGGGGIRNQAALVLDAVQLSDNTVLGTTQGDDGGGLLNQGTCSVTRSTIQGNFASTGGGVLNGGQGTLQMQESTVADNSSRGGGGLMNEGTMDLVNTTVSGNRAEGGSGPSGGGLWNRGRLEIVQSTIAHNFAARGGGIADDGTVTLLNTLLGANTGGNCRSFDVLRLQGHNLSSDSTCALRAGDLEQVDPHLGPLQDNGGPARTHGLKPGSPAIDAGTSLEYIRTDQRGVVRPQGKAFDIGAFELTPFSIVPLVAPLILPRHP